MGLKIWIRFTAGDSYAVFFYFYKNFDLTGTCYVKTAYLPYILLARKAV
jgi:hypothetical protein